MAWSPGDFGLDAAKASAADTVLFVDVDGVLNVGALDGDNAPLMLDRDGLEGALAMWSRRKQHPEHDSIERLVSISRRKLGHGEDATYAKLATDDGLLVSEVLVGRLAALIRAAGRRRLVVLSSLWQRPQHRRRVARLEGAISAHLGSDFAFDARTGPKDDCTAEARLRAIGGFVEGLCAWRGSAAERLRVLVLEDFHIRPLDGWTCDDTAVGSESTAELYIRRRAAASEVAVKLVHTYDEWRTAGGLRVQVGSGLTMKHFCEAARFLGGACDHCTSRGDTGLGRPASPELPAPCQRMAAACPGRRLAAEVAEEDCADLERPAKVPRLAAKGCSLRARPGALGRCPSPSPPKPSRHAAEVFRLMHAPPTAQDEVASIVLSC